MPAPLSMPFDGKGPAREVTRRLTALEERPRIIVPTTLVPRPINATPSSDWYQTADVASFASRWEHTITRWSQQAAWVQVPWRTGATTTGEVRLYGFAIRDGGPGGTYAASDAIALGAGSSGTAEFLWLHEGDIWTQTGILWVQGRRTAGSNSVELGFPQASLIDPDSATLGGT